jgi:hypothetical protein
MNDLSNSTTEPSSEPLSSNPKEIQPPLIQNNLSELLSTATKWFSRCLKAAMLCGSALVFSYFLIVGYAPIDSLSGIGSLAAFVAFIGVLLAFSYTVLWAMPTLVLHQWSTDATGKRLIERLWDADSDHPSVSKLLLFSAGTTLAPGLIFWPCFLSTFMGPWAIASVALGFVLCGANMVSFCRTKSLRKQSISTDKPEETTPKTTSTCIKVVEFIKNSSIPLGLGKVCLLLFISALSLPAILPATNLIEHSSYVSKNSDQLVVMLLYGSLFLVSISHVAIWRVSLKSGTSDAGRFAATTAGALLSVVILTTVLGSPAGIMQMIMSVSSMRLERTDIWIEGSFCAALAARSDAASSTSSRCLIKDARVTSRLGDRWWLDCTQARADTAAGLKHLGFSLPSAQVITWARKARETQPQDAKPLATGSFKVYSAEEACNVLIAP